MAEYGTEILAEQAIQFAESGMAGLYIGMFSSVVPFAIGKTYILVWNGTEYECTAAAASFNGVDGVGIGNFALAGLGENTGEPFLLGTATDGSMTVCYSTASGSNTISVYLVEEDAPTVTDTLVLLDNQGIEQHFTDVKGLKVLTTGGAEQTFIAGEAVEKTVNLDFSGGDMEVIPEEGALYSKVNIPKPSELIPEHVAEGVNLAGVVGTLPKSGGELAKSRAINFYDVYGNIVYSYTRAQAALLTELPPVPELGDLEGFWNCPLSIVQSCTDFLDVAALYRKNGNNTVVAVCELPIDSSNPLYFNFYQTTGTTGVYNYTVNMYVGADSTTPYTSKTNNSGGAMQFTYNKAGIGTQLFIFETLQNTNTTLALGGTSGRYLPFCGSTTTSRDYKLEAHYLRSVAIASGDGIGFLAVTRYTFHYDCKLKYIGANISVFSNYCPSYCYGLKTIALGNLTPTLTAEYTGAYLYSLERLRIGYVSTNYGLAYCYNLKALSITGTQANKFHRWAGFDVTIRNGSTTQYSISAYTTSSDLQRFIYVPDALADNYTYSNKKLLSEYPDY